MRRLFLSERQEQLECLLSSDAEDVSDARAVARWLTLFLERFDAAQDFSDEPDPTRPPEGNAYMEMSSDQSFSS